LTDVVLCLIDTQIIFDKSTNLDTMMRI
jgi:hypothetical protein